MKVEMNSNFRESNTSFIGVGDNLIMVTPPIEGNYWKFRVPLTDKQAIIAFPKFFTMGIGFQVEDADWNTNLPYTKPAEEIYNHIQKNKGDDSITEEMCIEAIGMIQDILKKVITSIL